MNQSFIITKSSTIYIYEKLLKESLKNSNF
jgi:hypothetical protein